MCMHTKSLQSCPTLCSPVDPGFSAHRLLHTRIMECVGKNPPVSAGAIEEVGSIPGSGRSSGEGKGHPLQYFCLENSTDGGTWWATVHEVAKSRTRLSC